MWFWYKTNFAIQFIRDKGNDLRSLLIAIVKLFIVRLDIKRGTAIVSFTTICTCVSIKSYTTAIKSFHLTLFTDMWALNQQHIKDSISKHPKLIEYRLNMTLYNSTKIFNHFLAYRCNHIKNESDLKSNAL